MSDKTLRQNGEDELSRDICGKVTRALMSDAEIDSHGVMVVAHNDRITLIGRVPTPHQREVARRAVWRVPGVTAVEDRLEID